MSRKRKKKRDDGHVDESWLLPYSDLLTLLLALFIVLFASSSVDERKLSRMSSVFSEIFDGGTGAMQNTSPTPVPSYNTKGIQGNANPAYLEDQQTLEEIRSSLDDYIAVNELENQFQTKLTEEGLLVTIRDSILFESGKATIKAEYTNLAKDIGNLLKFEKPRQIVVTGHTDNVPINNAEFPSNWELSMMRALNFLKVLIDTNNLDPQLFSVKGYGENKPVASNDTAEGRSKNRRVEVLIQPLVLEDGTSVE
ncbi:flagellar motor protein MotB [Sporosarcina thermotolerans]|uniref:Flagellar motor protein MotB n=1 Tax=Sporosarcina thermotolerans TaxID=633404 RepID=A0AAW9A8T2_9BACL|nr:flagellar motor protein MotB [Sporosarcina thermotolerans]MDW0117827.1 flagellar motor protein MotB [Sporosarcina thermotolerans]